MPNVNVTYDEMRDAAKRLRDGQSDIEGKLSELKRLVDGLVAGGYVTDSSSRQFQDAYTHFNKGATDVIQGLHSMSEYLTKAAELVRRDPYCKEVELVDFSGSRSKPDEPVIFVNRVRTYYDILMKLDDEERAKMKTDALKLKIPSI